MEKTNFIVETLKRMATIKTRQPCVYAATEAGHPGRVRAPEKMRRESDTGTVIPRRYCHYFQKCIIYGQFR